MFSSSGVLNATGYQNKLAPDTVLVIFGSAMGPTSLATGPGSNYPTSLAGTSITFTPAAGGAAINAKMVYSIAGQIAGLLPSSITPGTYAVRVTYNGVSSAPQNATVVARSFGIATANSAGTGTAQATIGNVNGGLSLTRFTSGSVAFGGFNWTLTPAHPGDTLVLWGTGGGADPANDTGGTSGDQTAAGNFMVNVGGRQIRPLYAGASSGYPGLWQINFTLPADITPDCFASVQVSAGGELSNTVRIPIAAAGQTACSDPDLSPEMLAKLDAGADIVFAAFGLYRARSTTLNATAEAASGFVARYKAAKFALTYSRPRFGYCRVYDRTYPVNGLDPASPEAALDAGAALPLSGPGLPQASSLGRLPAGPLAPAYAYVPSRPFEAGLYTLTGNGGSQVGPFSVSTNFPANFTVTNWDSVTAIDRTRTLTLNWTATGASFVIFVVGTTQRVGSSLHLVTIECGPIPADSGTYSIPPDALAYLTPGSATVSVQAVNQARFTAPLVGGGQTDMGGFEAHLGIEKSIPVQ